MRGRVVEAKRLRLDMELFVGTANLKLLEICVAVEEFLVIGDSFVFHPDIRVVQAIRKAADVRLPVPDQKIKIVRTVALWQVGGICRVLGKRWSRGCRSDHEQQNEAEFGFHSVLLGVYLVK